MSMPAQSKSTRSPRVIPYAGLICAFAGCNSLNSFRATPAPVVAASQPAVATGTLPTVPPVEPPSNVFVESQPDRAQLVSSCPAPPLRSTPNEETSKGHGASTEELAGLRESLETLQRQQAEILRSLEALKASDDRRDLRLIAVETQIATQSAVLAEVRRTLSDNQREQWRTLDVLSDGLDKILETEPVTPVPNVAGAGAGVRPRGASRSQGAVR